MPMPPAEEEDERDHDPEIDPDDDAGAWDDSRDLPESNAE